MIPVKIKDNDLIFEAYMDSRIPNFKVGDTVIPTAGIWLGHNGIKIKAIHPEVSEALIENHNGFVKKIALADLKVKTELPEAKPLEDWEQKYSNE